MVKKNLKQNPKNKNIGLKNKGKVRNKKQFKKTRTEMNGDLSNLIQIIRILNIKIKFMVHEY